MTGVISREPIGVGIVGASDNGWARLAHLPAIASLAGMEVRAVSTTRLESAQRAAADFGVPAAYDNVEALAADPLVDLIVVAVRVEHHADVLRRVAPYGKPVYCEWPSGQNLEETRALAALFEEKNAPAFTGLQARAVPGMRYVRDLVREGFVGRVLSTTLVGSGQPWGDEVIPSNAYLQDDSRGGTMLTIPFGHSLDAVTWALGEVSSIAAMTAVQRPVVRLIGTDSTVAKTTPDQILVSAELEGDIMLSAHYRGGETAGTTLRWEINGTEGTLMVTAASSLQIRPLTIRGASAGEQTLRDLPIPADYVRTNAALPYPALSVAEALFAVEQDLRTGSTTAPRFADAIRHKRVLESLRRAADSGITQRVT